jgi:DNA polymerase-1
VGGLDDVELTLVNNMAAVERLRSWLGNRRPINALGLDTETGGFDRRRDALRLVQVGDGKHGWAIPWDRWGGVFEDIVKLWDGKWILHNAPFDISFLDREGVVIPRHKIDDTMTLARINEPLFSMALKSQAARHIDAASGGLQAELAGTKWTWANVPIDYGPYWQYGALDPVLTYKLFEHHYPIAMAQASKAYDLELAVQWVTQRMERYGAHVDREFSKQKMDDFIAYCVSVEKWCWNTYGVKPGSNQAIAEILRRDGHDLIKQTAKGATSLDADVLEDIDHPLAKAVLQRRQLQKLASTYLKHFVDDADENDLLHPSINTLGAKTSRMSISDPSAQNLPRHGTSKAGDTVRSAWTTRYDDGAMLMCDFSQIEARLMAHYAADQGMISAFTSGGDFFVNLARTIFQDDTITKKDPRRQIVKNATYADLYGAGTRKFALTAGISEQAAREFMQRRNSLYPGVKRFQDTIGQLAAQRQMETGEAFVNSPFTGRRYVAEAGRAYALVNYVTQGGAAEIMKMKIVEMDAAGLGNWMVIPVHDEILMDVPGEHVRDAAETVRKIMNDDTLLSVPITAEVSYGKSWGSKTDWPIDEPTGMFWNAAA